MKRAGILLGPILCLAVVVLSVRAHEADTGAEESGPQPEPVVVPVGTHIPLVLQNSLNSKAAEVGDLVYCETIYPVVVENRILIPVGSFVRGALTRVKRPGRIKGRGEMHVRFDELTLPNGYTIKLHASLGGVGTPGNEEVDRKEGGIKSDSTRGEDVGTVAGTTGAGAGIGAIAAGAQGTAIGAGAGAAAGLAWTLLTRGREVEIPRGSTFEIILDRPLQLDATLVQFDWTGQASSLPGPSPRPERDRRPVGSRIPF